MSINLQIVYQFAKKYCNLLKNYAGGNILKKIISVLRAIAAQAVDFQRKAVVQIAAHRPSHNGNGAKPPIFRTANGKLVSSDGLVVTVMLPHKLVRLRKRNGNQRQHSRPPYRMILRHTARKSDVFALPSATNVCWQAIWMPKIPLHPM